MSDTLQNLTALHAETQAAQSLAQSIARREPYHAEGLPKNAERRKWEDQNAIARDKFKETAGRLSDAYAKAGYRAPNNPLDKGGLDEIHNRLMAEGALAQPARVQMSRVGETTTSNAEAEAAGLRQGEKWRDEQLAARGLD